MTEEPKVVPISLLETIMDKSDKALAKELTDLETAVTSLINNINKPPRVEDVNRIVESVKSSVGNSITDQIKNVDDTVVSIEIKLKELDLKVESFLSKIKWIAGIIIVVVGIAISVISYVNNITEKTITANTNIRMEEIKARFEKDKQQRDEEFKKIMDEIRKVR